jgi:hypothetical protein
MDKIISCQSTERSFSKTQSNCTSRIIKTYQRKANYNDKYRIRLCEKKKSALQKCRCVDTAEVKRKLKLLGIKLDLRLTTAWIAIEKELSEEIAALAMFPLEETSNRARELDRSSNIKVGERVFWKNAPAFVELWGALEVLAISGEIAKLELLERAIPLSELILAIA